MRGLGSGTTFVAYQMLIVRQSGAAVRRRKREGSASHPAPFESDGEKLAALALARLWGMAHNATAITAIAEG
jgi:hypothetical protein